MADKILEIEIIREIILHFALANVSGLVNTFYKKQKENSITFKSEKAQINYVMVKVKDLNSCKYCKVILEECLTAQHKILSLVINLKSEDRWAISY